MTITLRIVLLISSLLNCAWIIRCIRKAQAKIEDSVFWVLFSGLLVCMSIFPQMLEWGASITGVQSTVNFVFLVIIFMLIVKVFLLSIRLSQIECKLQTFAQTYAIDKLDLQTKKIGEEIKKQSVSNR